MSVRKTRKPTGPDVAAGAGAAGPDAESRAVAADAAFRALLEESRRRSAAGDRGRPAEDVFRELGLAEEGDAGPVAAERKRGGRNGTAGGPTPVPGGAGNAESSG